jgi:cell division protein FtsZ
MSPYPRHRDVPKNPTIRLVGIGNAGVHIADRIAARADLALETVAMNSDQQSINASTAARKTILGPMTTHGLGAGGDPETGLDAAKESMDGLRQAANGTDVLILCVGLGGGTGSAVAPILAKMGRDAGAFVAVVATSPFRFEGRRRAQQAKDALDEIGRHADALVHFENDRMSELVEPLAEVGETFAACDGILFQAVSGLARILTESGPLPVAVTDVISVLRAGQGSCLFGCGEAEGSERASAAIAQALRSPLLDRELLLHEAGKILVHVSGPSGTTFEEVASIMTELSKVASPAAQLCLGVGTSRDSAGPLIVTVVGRTGVETKRVPAPVEKTVEPAPVLDSLPATPSAPDLFGHESQPAKAPKVKQDVLQLEPVARGRFEKIEPTIVEGEDLDVPTFLRLKLKKKPPL